MAFRDDQDMDEAFASQFEEMQDTADRQRDDGDGERDDYLFAGDTDDVGEDDGGRGDDDDLVY
jgi:hypothetical protein